MPRKLEAQKKWVKRNPELFSQRKREYQKKHAEKRRAKGREHYKQNRELCLARCAAYRANNSENIAKRKADYSKRNAEMERARARRWQQANKARHIANVRAREISQMRAMPAWANRKTIAKFYAEAKRLTLETGITYHVDHIVPLRGKLVCGLHVESNLQVLAAKDNAIKANRWPIAA